MEEDEFGSEVTNGEEIVDMQFRALPHQHVLKYQNPVFMVVDDFIPDDFIYYKILLLI
jgi:hypothetical protein